MLGITNPQQPLIASVVAYNTASATYSMTCPSPTDSPTESTTECPLAGGALVTEAPSKMWHLVQPSQRLTESCSLSGTVPTVCTAQANVNGVHTSLTTTLPEGDRTDYVYVPVTITAGAEKITSATSTGGGHAAKVTGVTGVGAGMAVAGGLGMLMAL